MEGRESSASSGWRKPGRSVQIRYFRLRAGSSATEGLSPSLCTLTLKRTIASWKPTTPAESNGQSGFYLDFFEVERFFAVALPTFFPPLRLEAALDFLPLPEPLFLPP